MFGFSNDKVKEAIKALPDFEKSKNPPKIVPKVEVIEVPKRVPTPVLEVPKRVSTPVFEPPKRVTSPLPFTLRIVCLVCWFVSDFDRNQVAHHQKKIHRMRKLWLFQKNHKILLLIHKYNTSKKSIQVPKKSEIIFTISRCSRISNCIWIRENKRSKQSCWEPFAYKSATHQGAIRKNWLSRRLVINSRQKRSQEYNQKENRRKICQKRKAK